MKIKAVTVVNLILTLLFAASAPTVADTHSSGPRTLQQDFDDASADSSTGKCQSALPKFEALEHGGRVRPGSLPAAAIAVRKGICAIKLRREDANEAAIETGLATLDKAGGNFAIDVAEGWTALGDAAFRRYDYAGATRNYKNALARLKGEYRLNVLANIAKATTFDGNAEALSYADEGLKIIAAMPKPNKESLATFHTLHARTLLNQGNAQSAYKELLTAHYLSGGLTERTTLSEASLRSDLAMAAMLVGKKNNARLYLAYTGAGRIEKSSFKWAASMKPPLCGEETGLRPEDVAVVEFSLNDDGTVSSAQTVYSRGGPAVAAAFGKAVSEWHWKPEDIAAIPLFHRLQTRIELRCSDAPHSDSGVMKPLRERYRNWAVTRLPLTATTDPGAAKLREILHQYADDSAKRQDDTTRIAALGWLAYVEPASEQKRAAMADEALSLSSKTSVPIEVLNWLRIIKLEASWADKQRRSTDWLNALLDLADDPDVAKDALAANTLRLTAARGWTSTKLKNAPALIEKVARDDRLPLRHPLRQIALLDLAGKAAEDGNRAAAQSYFDQTGLTDEQCSLLGEAPTLKRTNVSGSDYPMEALIMGFEGWVQMELDIMTDGKTTNIRPIIAYPPLIFVDAATRMTKDLQYDVSFRPGSSLVCSAHRETFNFINPSNH